MSHPVDIRHVQVASAPPGAAIRRTRLGRAFEVGAELLVAAGISFGFFALFLMNLAIVFPSGLSLETLAAQIQAGPRREGSAATTQARASAGAPLPATSPVGRLAILHAAVRTKPADAIAWSPATDGLALWDRDGIQTGAHGRARLDLGAGGELMLEPNSLVIVSAGARGTAGRRNGAAVLVQEGEIWARFSETAVAPARITVGRVVVEPGQGPHADAEFRIHASMEGGSQISVLKGSLEVGSGAERVRLDAGGFALVSPSGAVVPARRLPPAPRPSRPTAGATFRYRRQPPQIEFRWAAIPRASRYRLVVAREGSERTIVVNQKVAWPALTVGRLADGRYQWRVSAQFGELEGPPSPWRTVAVLYEGPR